MDKTGLKRDWLAGNGIVAFFAAVILIQAWGLRAGSFEIPYTGMTLLVPHPGWFTVVVALFLLSFILVVASLMPFRLLPKWLIPGVGQFSLVLDFLVWVVFLVGWVGIISSPVDERWLLLAVFWGGLVMVVFLWVRFMISLLRTARRAGSLHKFVRDPSD